jgi:hypothetical protein
MPNMTTTNPAVIIGNGVTRRGIDLERFRKIGPIFGCNAIYREFSPDFLIAFDEKISVEIDNAQLGDINRIITPWNDQFEPAEANPSRPRNNAGMVAMAEAIKRGHDRLYLLGMDFVLEDRSRNLQTVYDGTNCYDGENRATYEATIARCNYFNWFTREHWKIDFVILLPAGKYSIRDVQRPNVSFLAYEELFDDKQRPNSLKLSFKYVHRDRWNLSNTWIKNILSRAGSVLRPRNRLV